MNHIHQPPSPTPLPPALVGAITGGLLVGLTSPTAAFAFIGPMVGYQFGSIELLILGLLGAVFGIIAGAVAGASDTGRPAEENAAATTVHTTHVRPHSAEAPAHPV
ncbi:MAG: hypothetical protein K0V04_11005 [Deltaproteobacteria bacterium]|nr:hypothetical protein [Deltaproteobacteria bacterium]